MKELSLIGLQIGADVPGFVMGKTAIVEGIGDILYPVIQKEKWYVVVCPYINLSTRNMFSSPFLMSNTPKKSIELLLNTPFSNDFEYIAQKQFITIKKLILMLSSYAPSRMTGTGSCIFSEFNNKKSAQKMFSLLPKNIRAFIAKSVNISPLHRALYNK